MTATALEHGYWRAYRQFYTWRNIARGAATHGSLVSGLRHFAYASGWKKFEPLWDLVIRAKQAGAMLPVLEAILSEFGRRRTGTSSPLPGRPDLPGLPASAARSAGGVIPLRVATGPAPRPAVPHAVRGEMARS